MHAEGDKSAAASGPASKSSSGPGNGILASLAGVARHLGGLVLNRLELAALELGEARHQAMRLLMLAALGGIALCFALAGWTALLVVLTWDALGWLILLLVAVGYSLLALVLLWRARALANSDQLTLAATMAELRKDREALLQGSESQ